jgi:hypothetical protein
MSIFTAEALRAQRLILAFVAMSLALPANAKTNYSA